ncbi:uncharacterized protein C8A04DRAFT_28541 [Dichotomopilus funicola]|uniref:Ams2/SPT21 N-terminal domain-containing protein n=1 Tax=Dichotomopilus funicola TaxID=1934379 RepID=A0AAN6V2R7_9PEZI|nr:hypothetical protein C8A04DRAFT_28541 [Dichotomopilus funicola]
MATPTNPWGAPSPQMVPSQPVPADDMALQARPMGLKVHYSFDRDNQVHCLARWHQILQIQTIPLDEKTTIGVVDLRTCLQAVSQSSPEILNQPEGDYSVYAYDYSEPEVPLVGQGLLSWNMDPLRGPQQQLVTGRVTRNLLALLNSGSRDMLEVKLKFATVARIAPPTEYPSAEAMNESRSGSIPAETASEWNSFIQSNTILGHPPNVSAVSSPALPPAQPVQYSQPTQYHSPMPESQPMDMRIGSQPPPQPILPAPRPANSMPSSRPSTAVPIPPRPQGSADNAPSPAPSQPPEPVAKPASRSRSKRPTGRPRGRPRKRPRETDNPSAVEDGTDGDDGPQKRRAQVTQTEYSAIAPFGAAPDSLRVAASTSGSLRSLRPVGAGLEGPSANHLQDVPRAPTPVPDGQMFQQQPRRLALENHTRAEHPAHVDQSGPNRPISQAGSQDGRSPAGSVAHSPDHGYSPEDSTGDLNSSPPVPRAVPYMQSSPPPTSPVLPTIPMPNMDSGFMSGGLDDMFDDDDMMQGLSGGQMQDQMLPIPPLPVAKKPAPRKNGRAGQQQRPKFPFQEVNPGPPELLPTKSIFNPAGKAKTLNRHVASTQPAPTIPASRSLKRSNTAPNPLPSEQEPLSQDPSMYEQNGNGVSRDTTQPYSFPDPMAFPDDVMQLAQAVNQETENGFPPTFPPEPAPTDAISTPMPIPDRPESEPALPVPPQPESISMSRPSSRPASREAVKIEVPLTEVPLPEVPASEPVREPMLTFPTVAASEPPCPPSDFDPPRYSKNLVKKQSIKEKLEDAIARGESPPFCRNCGAIETPTWRKIWTQDREGKPEFHEFSDKPGCVTMIEVLERDENEDPSKYRIVKKNLGPKDERAKWLETMLCNPCGIWLGKFKGHRPPDRWDKDAARLNQQPRRKKDPKGSKSKKTRTKSDARANPTSEAYFTTDPIGPLDHDFLTENYENGTQTRHQSVAMTDDQHLNLQSSPRQRFLGSTHSRGSGTAESPIAVEDELGSTRRLLFPSPRRDGTPKVLGELSLNTAQQTANHATDAAKLGGPAATGKENSAATAISDVTPRRPGTPTPEDELEQELFGTPPARPSTPPPRAAAGPFKTPTRPTPSHRPITRSISRSIRSSRNIAGSPSQVFAHPFERTPTKTPRSGNGGGEVNFLHPSSASKRRSPRHGDQQLLHADFGSLDEGDENHHRDINMAAALQMPVPFDSPFTATLHQLLSEANDFISSGSPSASRHASGVHHNHHGQRDSDPEVDLVRHLGDLEGAGDGAGGSGGAGAGGSDVDGGDADFRNFLGTDLIMPSSPPLLRSGRVVGNSAGGEQFGGALH